MPYIYCETCGAACYSNVLSCPACARPVRRVRGGIADYRRHPSVVPMREDVEDEVRERLYGWHSGCVELRAQESA